MTLLTAQQQMVLIIWVKKIYSSQQQKKGTLTENVRYIFEQIDHPEYSKRGDKCHLSKPREHLYHQRWSNFLKSSHEFLITISELNFNSIHQFWIQIEGLKFPIFCEYLIAEFNCTFFLLVTISKGDHDKREKVDEVLFPT